MNTLRFLRFRTSMSVSVSTPSQQSRRATLLIISPATNRYFSSDVPRAAGEQFTGDVPLEKFLTKQLMDARKKKDGFRTNLLRTVIGELQTEHKSLSSKFDTTSEKLEESALKSVRKAITKRKAAASEYRSSNLADAASHEEQEAAFLESLLPKQLSKEEVQHAVEVTYASIKEEGLFGVEGSVDVQSALRRVNERLEGKYGKGLFSKGDIAGAVMPLLQKDGFVRGKKRA